MSFSFRKDIDKHSGYLTVVGDQQKQGERELILHQENHLFNDMVAKPKKTYMIPSRRTQTFKNISSLHLKYNLLNFDLNNTFNNNNSSIFFIQISEPTQSTHNKQQQKILRVQNKVDTKSEIYKLGQSALLLIQLDGNDQQEIFLDTNNDQTQFTISSLQSQTPSSFSAVLSESVHLKVNGSDSTRIDGWFVDTPPFFDASYGLMGGGGGIYVVPTNGFYFVSLNLMLVKSPLSYLLTKFPNR